MQKQKQNIGIKVYNGGCQGLWGEENGESVFNGNEALVWEGDKFWRWMTAFHPTRWMDLMPLNSSLDYKLSMHITICKIYVIVVQLLSSVWLFATPWTAACQTSWSFIISHSVLKLMSIESVMPANHLILCGFLLLLPSIFPTIRVFSNESVLCIRWPEYWSFSFSISPSKEYSGLISSMMDCLDLLAVQGTLKSLLQHHSSNNQFFSTQLSLWSNSHIHTWLLEKR